MNGVANCNSKKIVLFVMVNQAPENLLFLSNYL